MATKIRANRFGYAVSEVLARIGGMKTMSRVIRAVGVILAIGLSLAGCANSGGVQGDTPPPLSMKSSASWSAIAGDIGKTHIRSGMHQSDRFIRASDGLAVPASN